MHPSTYDRNLLCSDRRGFTLIEIAIVLGIVGVVLGGIWYVASMVRENARVSQAINQINIIAQNMTSMLQGGYNPPLAAGTSITTNMISAQVIPSWAATSTTTASQPWSSTGFSMYWMSNNPHEYRMSFYQVTQPGCVGLLSQATGCTAGQPGCPVNIVVGQGAASFNLLTQTLTTTQIQTLCSKNSYTGGSNSVEFDFQN